MKCNGNKSYFIPNADLIFTILVFGHYIVITAIVFKVIINRLLLPEIPATTRLSFLQIILENPEFKLSSTLNLWLSFI